MRGTLARLPVGLRLAVGAFTVCVFAFFGFTWLPSNRAMGAVLLVLAVVRALSWLREVRAVMAARDGD
jgi:uncharacterized membrane protein (UPF0136 family)